MMNGIELAARFSYITNSLHFCGPSEANKEFLEYFKGLSHISSKQNPNLQKISNKENKNLSNDKILSNIKTSQEDNSIKNHEEKIKKLLLRFEGLYPYFSTIAEASGKDIFDYEVVEAYWIGNALLDKLDDSDLRKIIDRLVKRGLPKSFGEKLKEKMPSGLAAHHNFNVMYVGVGMLTGSVPTSIQNMENCRISYGRVLEVLPSDKLIVDSNILKKENNKIKIIENQTKTAVYLPELLPGIKAGDYVALHWGFAPMVLDEEQLRNLKKYSDNTINSINAAKI
ncbi:hypothetical protein J4212_01785 [Candidatus Woesearchaeota archaeon]|nr:hypothetical protein [Candidatus Woesearchaeota archaeon]